MNPDGSGVVRLTNSPGYDAEPAISPDGRKVAFASFREGTYCCGVYVMSEIDGSGVVRLTSGRAPAWSRDGSKITFTRDANGRVNGLVLHQGGEDRIGRKVTSGVK